MTIVKEELIYSAQSEVTLLPFFSAYPAIDIFCTTPSAIFDCNVSDNGLKGRTSETMMRNANNRDGKPSGNRLPSVKYAKREKTMSKQEQGLMKRLEEKDRSPSEEFLLLYLKATHDKADYMTAHQEEVQE